MRKFLLAHIFASIYLRIMKTRKDIFYAIADPTRRAIIMLVAAQPCNVNSLAEKFDMTRQAVSLHVQILEDCGLLAVKKAGRERFCEARLDKLGEVEAWIGQSRKLWAHRFEKLDNYLTELKSNSDEK